MKVAEIMSADPATLESSRGLAEAINLMSELDVRHLPVMREGRVVGVVSDRDLLESTGWMWNGERGKAPAILEDVLQPEPLTIGPEESVSTLARVLVEWGVGCAPVVDGGRLCGIATEIDVLKALVKLGETAGEAARITVAQRMTSDVVAIDAKTTAAEALALMGAQNVRHLPVLDRQSVLGIVSDRDLRALLGRALPGTTPVKDFMTRNVESVAPDDDLIHAARRMAQRKIGALPVVDREGLVGMLTVTDLLDHCAGMLG